MKQMGSSSMQKNLGWKTLCYNIHFIDTVLMFNLHMHFSGFILHTENEFETNIVKHVIAWKFKDQVV